jgi:catechol 2,3-dioxygenase-like lactoylglutathione lyase family enzyme
VEATRAALLVSFVMSEQLIPVFRVKDGDVSKTWYQRLGFEIVGEHRFTPKLPLYLFMRRNGVDIHLSEHKGDAPNKSLAYFFVEDLEQVAAEFGVAIRHPPWGPELELIDPDGNTIRVALIPVKP